MSCTVDHLAARRRVRVLRPFTDLRGTAVATGVTALVRAIALDWPRRELSIAWERAGANETLVFSLDAQQGPRNGHMREYFDVIGEEGPPPRPPRAPETPAPAAPPPVTEPSRYEAAVARVHALVAAGRWAEAEEQIRTVLSWPDNYGGVLESLADDLVSVAVAQAARGDAAGYRWARERALALWHAWGSGATSGGEGAVMSLRIERARERLDRAARA